MQQRPTDVSSVKKERLLVKDFWDAALRPPDYTFELQRLSAHEDFAILDTPAERGFDDIVELARHVCETPVALVSFVSHNRQWINETHF